MIAHIQIQATPKKGPDIADYLWDALVGGLHSLGKSRKRSENMEGRGIHVFGTIEERVLELSRGWDYPLVTFGSS